MIVTINGSTYSTNWSYSKDRGTKTICIIKNAKNGEHKGTGTASVFVEDRFCKNDGRKITLKRALKNCLLFNKLERQTFWKEYHKMRHNKW